jgi:biotin operon repressor
MSDYQRGDHVHEIAISYRDDEYGKQRIEFEPVDHFPYSQIDENLGLFEADPDQQISFADAAACWSLLLEWIVAGPKSSLAMAGARSHALRHFLDSDNCRFKSLQAIADEAGCTRAALSKFLLELRDQLQIGFEFKRVGARNNYREGQIRALERGTHSSTHRKDAKSSKPRKQVDPELSARMRARVMVRWGKAAQSEADVQSTCADKSYLTA